MPRLMGHWRMWRCEGMLACVGPWEKVQPEGWSRRHGSNWRRFARGDSVAGPDGGHDLGASRQIGWGHRGGQMLSGNYHPVFLARAPANKRTDGAQPLPKSGPLQRARYPQWGAILYPTLGSVAVRAGEVADKVKKGPRRPSGVFRQSAALGGRIKLELGDVLWYVAQLSSEYSGFDLAEGGQRQIAQNWPRASAE